MSTLTSRQESRIYQASRAGIKPVRIAELVGCTEQQVLKILEEYDKLNRERDEWDAIIERERPK